METKAHLVLPNEEYYSELMKEEELPFDADLSGDDDDDDGELVSDEEIEHDKIVEDLKKSSDILGGATVFCYPFGHYNDAAKKAVKDAGYHLAFTIEGGRVHKGNDKYALPRVRISRGVSLNSFKTMVN